MGSINRLKILGLSSFQRPRLFTQPRTMLPHALLAAVTSASFSWLHQNRSSHTTTAAAKDTLNGWACFGKGQELVKAEFPLTKFDNDSVDVDIICCGICGTDIHVLDSGWKPTNYPCVVSELTF